MITLVIVNCQNDFITGKMMVKGAKSAVEEIKNFIKKHHKEIEKIIFTIDWHPNSHYSFIKNRGVLPTHCVQYTPGACIESKLLKLIHSLNIDYEVSKKGEVSEVDQLGAFDEIELVSDELGQHYYFDSIASANADSNFVVCGIAGDFCVKETISNMIEHGICPKVFNPGIISTDGGKSFSEFVKENKLKKIV